MEIKNLSESFSVTGQINAADLDEIKAAGFDYVVCNRPDGESSDQPPAEEIAAACEACGLGFAYLPLTVKDMSSSHAEQLSQLMSVESRRILAYCRSGKRSATLWAMAVESSVPDEQVHKALQESGLGVSEAIAVLEHRAEVVILGGGAGGLATAASLLRRRGDLDVLIIEPSEEHYYQPGWTLVGAGVFQPSQTVRKTSALIPTGARWLRDAVSEFDPERSTLTLESGASVRYEQLVVSTGIELNWGAIEGAEQWLGSHGVTSNYRFDLAPYTWQLVRQLQRGKAVFSQPPMPIKCAGAPQKAMYLSADYWFRQGRLNEIAIDFYNAGEVLFGVADYVPALEKYVDRYQAKLHFKHQLKAIDGAAQTAYFDDVATGEQQAVEFDFLHVCPPQRSTRVVRESALADAAGWLEVDQYSLRHPRFENVFGLGDGCSAPNAKTAAAVRKQAPVVAENLLATRRGESLPAIYQGYGSCPLTVERGKVVLAEFGYGGVLQPSVPRFVNDGTRATWLGWLLKARLLPPIYFHLMLKGREWLAAPAPAAKETAT